ncbi:LGFP repeat-containing protein [Rhodococcus sp. IEGM1428]|uniref:LGFP repeat-containing protein n=1 Tax=Rhodococcus sp. IEGM1428 TaxID=3392191 RepID=UPI003D15070E
MCGAILDEYLALGGPQSFLLLPTSGELVNPDGVGRRSQFVGGNIYWSPDTGAHFVAHDFLTKWGDYGYETGFLQYPTTDEIVLGDGLSRRQEFQGGSIYFSFATGAHTIYGLIKQAWVDLGAETSYLGFPTSDEQDTPDRYHPYGTRENTFQTGVITADLTNGSTHVGNWSAYPGSNVAARSTSSVAASSLPPLRAQDLPAEQPEQSSSDGTEPQARQQQDGSGCPDGTTDYEKSEWNCESVTEDLSFYEMGLRKGEARGARIDNDGSAELSDAGFGRLHAGEDHNVGPHSLQLIAQDAPFCSPLGYKERCSYTEALHFDEDYVDSITVVVQQGPDTEGRAPDQYDVGVVTAFCEVGDPASHIVGYCSDDLPPPFNGGKNH